MSINSSLKCFVHGIKASSSILFEIVERLDVGVKFVLPLLDNKVFDVRLRQGRVLKSNHVLGKTYNFIGKMGQSGGIMLEGCSSLNMLRIKMLINLVSKRRKGSSKVSLLNGRKFSIKFFRKIITNSMLNGLKVGVKSSESLGGRFQTYRMSLKTGGNSFNSLLISLDRN